MFRTCKKSLRNCQGSVYSGDNSFAQRQKKKTDNIWHSLGKFGLPAFCKAVTSFKIKL